MFHSFLLRWETLHLSTPSNSLVNFWNWGLWPHMGSRNSMRESRECWQGWKVSGSVRTSLTLNWMCTETEGSLAVSAHVASQDFTVSNIQLSQWCAAGARTTLAKPPETWAHSNSCSWLPSGMNCSAFTTHTKFSGFTKRKDLMIGNEDLIFSCHLSSACSYQISTLSIHLRYTVSECLIWKTICYLRCWPRIHLKKWNLFWPDIRKSFQQFLKRP